MSSKKWQRLGQRLRKMDRAELLGRARQEIAKRTDAARYWMGHEFSGKPGFSSSTVGAKFFFAPDSVDSIFALMRERLPGRAEEIVRRADRICCHRFDLLGYEELEYEATINWHLDAVHNKQAPKKIFYRVPYLDYSQVGDAKVIWELNRHQHFVTLAKAYGLTGELRYADEILRQARDWRAQNPYPFGVNWASSLEVAFRSLAWLWTMHLLQGAPCVPEFRAEWVRGLELHGRHIERYLSTYFSPNTHLLGEGVGLFFLGLLCPELDAAPRWKQIGWEIVLREAERQVGADGFHFERSTYYHVYALDFFLHAALLAGVNGIPVPKSLDEILERMLSALCLLGRHGPPLRWGDDDGGRVFDPQQNRAEDMIDPLATGAILFHRGDFKRAAGRLREETLWLLGEQGVRDWDALEENNISTHSAGWPHAGLYLLSEEKSQLVMSAGSSAEGPCGHVHADALGVCLQSEGNAFLIDPGSCEYAGPARERDLFRGTAMHNTLCVDGKDQVETAAPFSWRGSLQSKIERWIQGEHFDVLIASHDGYQRLQDPVVHRRWVVSLGNSIYLVRDVAEGRSRHRLDVRWHLSPELRPISEGVFEATKSAARFALLGASREVWQREVSKNVWSPVYGQKEEITTVNFGVETALPSELAVLLALHPGLEENAGLFSAIQVGQANIRAYEYVEQEFHVGFFFRVSGKHWRAGALASDAEFLCHQLGPNAGDERIILCGGSYAQIDDGLELRCSRTVEWAELAVKGRDREIFCSDLSAIDQSAREAALQAPSATSR